MFWNIFGKRVISSFRSKDAIIWNLLFPLILSTLFFFAFTSIDSSNTLQAVKTAVVNNNAYQEDVVFRQILETVSKEGVNQILELTVADTQDTADAMLKKGEINGYILLSPEPSLTVKENGLEETILKSFLDSYLQQQNSIRNMAAVNPSILQDGTLETLFETVSFTEEISLTQNPPTQKGNYYYALLAMVCLYGGFQGLNSVTSLQANLSSLGARRTISPVSRLQLVLYDLLGGLAVHFLFILIVVFYITFVLGVSFGPNIGLVLLACLLGSLMGIAFGAFISITSKLKANMKAGILVTVTMICSFLSGLMISGINYTIAQTLPVLAWINPAARITDAFYCLYYYDTYERFFLNIGILAAMAAAMFTVTIILARRQRYESI